MNKVSVIIINYNTFTLTSNCIRSVIAHTHAIGHEIILVDNASTECDAGNFLKEFPSIKLVRSERNGGFAYGNNLGIEKATGDLFLLLNSDTVLQEDSISRSVEYMQQHSKAGVLGCRMAYPNGKVQYSARRFRSISWELLDLFRFIPWLMPYKKRAAWMSGKYFRHDENMECDWVNGAFFLFPREVFDQLPGKKLDDRFFMYGEDQLWCEQIKNMGYKILFYSGTTIIHINSGSTDQAKLSMLRKTMMKHELEIMRQRKGKGMYYFIFKIIFVTKEATRNLIKSMLFSLTGRRLR
ncbi:MAG TPA: glycosyltransferase family 2 protein [Chitinophagaceae bacterium]|nr:glycosyltransferase family 2 protein [Chitinophagaceae bacterium]